ncbi:MAG: prepilin-type N-terminal cleavage/methylation domain-containing protein [Planctomycetota bacterium]
MPPRPPSSRRSGFTLTELIVVVAVLAIVAALAAPRMGRADSSVLRSAAQQVAADLRLIQNEAMAHGDEVRCMDWYLGTGEGYVLLTDFTSSTSFDPEHDDKKLYNALTNRVYQVSFGQDAYEHLDGVWLAKSNLENADRTYRGVIRFGRFGQVVGVDYDPAVVLARGDRTLTITVDRDLGEVTIDPDFGDLSAIGGIDLPGPSSAQRTLLNPPG